MSSRMRTVRVVIDDLAGDQTMMETVLLHRAGMAHDALPADRCGQPLLATLATYALVQLDSIVINLDMHALDAARLIARMRATPWFAATTIMALTATAMPCCQARAAGADGVLRKPLHATRFLRHLQALRAGQTIWEQLVPPQRMIARQHGLMAAYAVESNNVHGRHREVAEQGGMCKRQGSLRRSQWSRSRSKNTTSG